MDPSQMFPSMSAPSVPSGPSTTSGPESLFPSMSAPSTPQAGSPALSNETPTESQHTSDGDPASVFDHSPMGEYSLTVPDGYEHIGLTLDPVMHKEFIKEARSLGINRAKAQALLNLHARAVYGPPKGKN